MKKSLILIAAAALLFAGCTDKDIIRKDINESKGDSNGAITFNAFAEKVTKAENSTALYNQTFFNHQESFQVWARKSNQPNQEIFNGSKVKVKKSGDNYAYTYAPERFWDKLAPKYHFYAAAPARTTTDDWYWTFNSEDIEDAATIGKGYFSIKKNFTLNEVNLKHTDNGGADHALEKVFKNIPVSSANTKTDTDLLIAAPAEVAQSYYNVANPNAVNLNFIHILSKLNVTVKTSLGTVTPTDGSADHTYSVKVLAFEVKNVPNVGKFNENPNNLATNNKQIRWTLTNPESKKTNILTGIAGLDNQNNIKNDALSVPYNPSESQKLYIVESLFLPQEIKYQRVALDGVAHDITDLNQATPYTDFTAYTTAKGDNATLTEAQFNALITSSNNEVAFKTWANYTPIVGETDDRINETTFNARVTEATKEGTTPFESYAEYAETKGEGKTLTENQFNALIVNGAFVDWDDYDHTSVTGETDNSIDRITYNKRVAEASNTTETLAPAYPEPSEPYFTITYSIDNEIFTASYNLAAAFKNMDNNQFESDGVTDKNAKYSFYEGWQNTLNITINPTAIEFTADVAEWADNEDVDYTIENGNE